MTDIVDLVSGYLGDPVGHSSAGNYKFRCPFHKGGQERRPAFYMHGDTGVAFCHACNHGWSLLSLLKDLGAPAGLRNAAAAIIGPPTKRNQRPKYLFDPALPEDLLGVFEHCPVDLLDVGFRMPLLKEFEVGFDHEHGRITYPLRDHLGRLVAISGRHPKYGYRLYGKRELREFMEDARESEVKKSRYLWNMHRIYPALVHGECREPIVVVEGFKACLWLVQCGYLHTVALMGSYLSEDQARLLERAGMEIIVFLDQDSAGRNGTKRCVDRLSRSSLVRIVDYPRPGKLQPDDLTEVAVGDALDSARPYYQRRI